MRTKPLAWVGPVFFACALRSTAAIAPSPALPAPLRTVDPHTLSAGLYLSLAGDGHFGGLMSPPAARSAAVGPDKGRPPVTLGARVGDNLRVGADPAALASSQRSQAEPHLWRSAVDPEFLVATFQEGRFADGGGSLDCGYGVSADGGLTWTRTLIPRLTTASGGRYVRATDPVAAIDRESRVFLVTLVARQSSFADGGVVVVSRSTDGGATFADPVVVAAGSASHMLDKEWLAVNDYDAASHPNRLAATWTDISSTNSYDLFASVSDNAGATWTNPVLIKPADSSIDQATQPVFLPDGSLLVPYVSNLTATTFRIECKRSIDGGLTFPASPTVIVPSVLLWNDPSLRSGTFLITAWVARDTGAVFLTYAGLAGGGQPRVFVTRSTNNGVAWSAPVAVSDNPAGISVVNPAIAATPDGRRVTVIYYDKRNNAPGADEVVDLYANTSFDGGATWSAPGLRLTEYSSDFRVAPLTADGYMLGDYQGVVPPLTDDQPAVALTIDTREADGDPITIRYALAENVGFASWRVARFSPAELADAARTGLLADFDGDGLCNAAEFFHQTNPRAADFGSVYQTAASSSYFAITYRYRLDFPDSVINARWSTSVDGGATWSVAAHDEIPNDFPGLNDNTGVLHFPLASDAPQLFREEFWVLGDPQTFASGETLVARSDARLVNVSTRGQVKTGESQLIVGFVTAGGTKTMLVRGLGPTLGPLGIANPLPNPQLDLQAGGSPAFPTVHNDDWSQGDATRGLFARLGAGPLAADSLDSAIVAALAPRPYSAILSDTLGRTGLALVEAYDADAAPGAPSGPRLVNLSSRGEVGPGENLLIGGFVIVGRSPKRVLLRAVGPTLADQGVVAVLADPVLTLYRSVDGISQRLAANDDWQLAPNAAALADTARAVGAFALRTGASRDAALLLTLEPGIYSAQIAGFDGGSGVALIEIYDAD